MNFLQSFDKRSLAVAAMGLVSILFVAVNLLSETSLDPVRLDLTEDRIFTLSDGTREVLAGIDEPITLRYFYSRTFDEVSALHASYGNRVRELLEHYVNLVPGKLRLEVRQPDPFSADEDEAVAFGLQGIPLNRTGDLGYFGLAATNSTDDQETIAFFEPDREPYLEYDLTRLIFNLSSPKKKVIGFIGTLPIGSDPANQYRPWAIMEPLEQFFEVRVLTTANSEIAEDVDVLLIAHPWESLDATLYAIDQFVLRGGRALILVDPHSEIMSQRQQGPMGGPRNSNLERLFGAWGVDFSGNKFVGDLGSSIKVSAPVGDRVVHSDYVAWLGMGRQNLNDQDVITDRIRRIVMATAGYFTSKEGATTTLTPLISSTNQSMSYSVGEVQGTPNPVKLLSKFEASNQRFTIAGRIHGAIKSAFPDGPPKISADDEKNAEKKKSRDALVAKHIGESQKPINLIVVGDTDFVADRFWSQTRDLFGQHITIPTANNIDFIVNALDNLGGSNALIGLRSRGHSVRPFHRLNQLQSAAELRFRRTEQGLREKMLETQAKLGEFQTSGDGEGQIILTDKQQATIGSFRSELLGIRRQLRDVQHALRKDIDDLDTWLKVVNIWAMPVAISILALILAMVRRHRYRRYAEAD